MTRPGRAWLLLALATCSGPRVEVFAFEGHEIRVSRQHTTEWSEPGEYGPDRYPSEYDYYAFALGASELLGDSSADEPGVARLTAIAEDGKRRLLTPADFDSVLVRGAVQYLGAAGKIDRRWLDSANELDGYSQVPRSKLESWELGPDAWPTTCDAAARDAIGILSSEDRELVRKTPRDDLIRFYRLGWGLTIRNRQGLWRGNWALIESCLGKRGSPEDASMIIMERGWDLLQPH